MCQVERGSEKLLFNVYVYVLGGEAAIKTKSDSRSSEMSKRGCKVFDMRKLS